MYDFIGIGSSRCHFIFPHRVPLVGGNECPAVVKVLGSEEVIDNLLVLDGRINGET